LNLFVSVFVLILCADIVAVACLHYLHSI